MKQCNTCNELKLETDFAKNYNKCKKCCYETSKIYRASPKGKAARQREAIKARLSGKKQERQSKYNASEKGIATAKKYEAKRYSTVESKTKLAAKNAVRYALKTGKLEKMACFVCGNINSESHHPSYAEDMRLSVVWLCKQHHNEIHNNPYELSAI